MLIHISPTMYLVYDLVVELIDIVIPELNITLIGGKDVVVRRPLPNKGYNVVCRKTGKVAIDGIFIETPNHVAVFTVVARWLVHGNEAKHEVTHRVEYRVADSEFDTVTDKMSLWGEHSAELGGWSSRYPKGVTYKAPVKSMPRAELWPTEHGLNRVGLDLVDKTKRGLIVERTETFVLPTIERERMMCEHYPRGRFPTIEDAFRAV